MGKEVNRMSYKGTRRKVNIENRRPSEIGQIGDAYQNLGWIEVEVVPYKYIIFEWQLDTFPVYPDLAFLG